MNQPVIDNVIPLWKPAAVRLAVLNGTVVPESRTFPSEDIALLAIEEAKSDPTATYIAVYVDGQKHVAFGRSFSKRGVNPTWQRMA